MKKILDSEFLEKNIIENKEEKVNLNNIKKTNSKDDLLKNLK